MSFKINMSHNGKAAKLEVESEELVGKSIGDKISGEDVDASLEGYELEITGTSDKSGFPGMANIKGPGIKKVLTTYGKGMKKRPKGNRKKSDKPLGLRLRKTFRGSEISTEIVQINIKVLKEGKKKFEDLLPKKEGEAGVSEGGEEKPVEEVKEEVKVEEKVEEPKKEEVKEEKKE